MEPYRRLAKATRVSSTPAPMSAPHRSSGPRPARVTGAASGETGAPVAGRSPGEADVSGAGWMVGVTEGHRLSVHRCGWVAVHRRSQAGHQVFQRVGQAQDGAEAEGAVHRIVHTRKEDGPALLEGVELGVEGILLDLAPHSLEEVLEDEDVGSQVPQLLLANLGRVEVADVTGQSVGQPEPQVREEAH